MKPVTFVLSALLMAIAPTVAMAQAPLRLSLAETIARGLEQSPRVAEVRAREEAATSAVAAARAERQPTLTALSSFLRTNHVDEFGVRQPDGSTRLIFPDIPTNYRVRAELLVPLYTSGRSEAAIRAAESRREAVTAEREAAEDDVALDLTRAYWGLVTSRERVHVLDQALARADAVVSDVRARVDAGVAAPNEALSAEAQRARQSVRLIQARHEAAIAEVTLGRLLGLPIDQSLDPTTPVTESISGAAALASEPTPALVARALETRPERRGLLDQQAALRAGSEGALAMARPHVSALAAVEPAKPNARFVPRTDRVQTSWDLGVTLTWPLWDGGRARAASAEAGAKARAVSERVREFDATVSVEVRQRVLAMEASRAALGASDQAVAAAAEARRVVTERFRVGVATSTDVLDAELALVEAELEHTELAAGLRVNEARLLRVVGGA